MVSLGLLLAAAAFQPAGGTEPASDRGVLLAQASANEPIPRASRARSFGPPVPVPPVPAVSPAVKPEPDDEERPPVYLEPAAGINYGPPSSLAPHQPFVVLTLGPDAGIRSVTYRDRLTPALAGYQSGVMGLLTLTVELYPAAATDIPVVKDLGLVGSLSRSLSESVRTADGKTTLHDTWTLWDAGLQWRGVFGNQEWLAVSLRYGSQLDDLTPPLTGVLLPTGSISYLRPALDVHIPLGIVTLLASGGYRAVMTRTIFSNDFPRATVGGIDAGAGLRVTLTSMFALQLSAKYIRYFYSLYPAPGDPYVAGGALDEYGVVDLAFLFQL